MRPWVVFGVWMDGESRVKWGHMVQEREGESGLAVWS